MFRGIEAYQPGLLLLAGLVGLVTSLTVFAVYSRALKSSGRERHAWIGLNALVIGLGLWSTNFGAVLAYNPAVPATYDPTLTALSLLVAIAWALPVGWVVLRPKVRQVAIAGGLYIASGIAIVQATSLLAIQTATEIVWYPAFFIFGLIACGICCCVALGAARQSRRWTERCLAAALFTTAIAAQQFASTTGLEFVASEPAGTLAHGFTGAQMAVALATASMLLIGVALGFALFVQRMDREAGQRFRELADAAVEGLVICEQGRIKDANASFLGLLGCSHSVLRNQPLLSFVPEGYRDAFNALSREPREIELVGCGGETILVEMTALELSPHSRSRKVYAVQDIRERKATEARIQYLAQHDTLTGLPNRATLKEKVERKLEHAWLHDEQFALLSLDIDRFKEINDVFGYAAGDAVLAEVTRRLVEESGADILVARLGADEFAVVSGRCDTAWASSFAERLLLAMAQEFNIADRKVSIAISIGIVLFPSHGRTTESLLANADVALLRSKERGGSSYCFYDSEMDLAVRERRALTKDLAETLERADFELHFQPQATLSDLTITGFEALVRWRHPELGYIAPGEFVALAEEHGMVHDLGLWVLRRACIEAASWANPIDIAVNVSPVQLQRSDLPERVLAILMESGLPAARLELEVTETALIKDLDRALSMLRRLKNLGLRIAMDDFGTGWSSLSTLQAFPFDRLKIDRAFVSKIGEQNQAEVIIRSVLGLCRSLRIPVLAEGVETQEQLEFLREEGCDELQGYLLSRPGPIETFDEITGYREPSPILSDEFAMPVPRAANV